ncbi:MAG: hypothetical protein VXZ53_17245, partial [Planctomycetota bacterium]|nr:hypothetical protein [Planctomycetota bacterium]
MSSNSIRTTATEAKKLLMEGREQVRRRHEEGGSGTEIGHLLTDLVDTLVLKLLHEALREVKGAGESRTSRELQ